MSFPEETPVVTDEPVLTEEVPAEPPPPPIEAPPVQESLAEQVHREAHTVPESTGPADWVPNRAQIRPPEVPEVVVEELPPPEDPEVDPQVESVEPAPERASAADLIAQAEAADTDEELDAIEAQADGRVTVLNAVAERRAALTSV